MIELKPCPFCGGNNVRAEEQRNNYTQKIDGGVIICYDCLCTFFQLEAVCMEDLIDAWNRRA